MEHPKILHNGQLVHTTNSEGQRIHPTDEGIKNFHDWFSGSKVVDKHGRPQVHYHGTFRPIDSFKKIGSDAVFFSRNPKIANDFAMLGHNTELQNYSGDEKNPNIWKHAEKPPIGGANILPVYIRATNVFDYRNPQHKNIIKTKDVTHNKRIDAGHWGALNNNIDKIKSHGFDAHLENEHGYSDAENIAVYDPKNVKSAIGNTGAFSHSPKINESLFGRYKVLVKWQH
jgi:hypothetical protein